MYDKFLVEEFQNENVTFVDATFKVCPDFKGVKQFLTVMSKKYDIVSKTQIINLHVNLLYIFIIFNNFCES